MSVQERIAGLLGPFVRTRLCEVLSGNGPTVVLNRDVRSRLLPVS